MMMRSLLLKTLYDRRWFIFGWTMGIIVLCWVTVLFYPSFAKTDTFDQLSRSLPQGLSALKGFLGDANDMKVVGGYIATQLYDIRLPMFLMVTSLILALGMGSSDEERGRLRTLSSTPLSRTRILFEQWVGACIILTIISIGSLIGSALGAAAIGEAIPYILLLKLTLLSWLFSVTLFTLVYAAGIGFGKRAIAMTIGIFLAVGGFMLTTFAQAVDWLKDWQPFSLLYYLDAKGILHDGINVWHIAVFTALILLALAVGTLGFRRRDISG